MFFYASKIAFILVQPSTLCLSLIAVGSATLYRWPASRLGRRLTLAGVVALAVAGFSPLANLALLPLEQRFVRPDLASLPRPPAGIILLGGFEDGTISAARGELALNEAAERLTEGFRLALRLPAAKVVFTGGVGELLAGGPPAGEAIAAMLIAAGVARDRILIEQRSRTTWENATYTRELVRPAPGETWLLVTSAYHMPRAIGVFRRAGFEVTAWPVDYRTSGVDDLVHVFSSLGDGLKRFDTAAREWLGLLAYRLTGRSSALFPAP
jgi:uncharacterized SAM-binding protein YcdF (DUF218 family)